MNDDITPRELELVDAILTALDENAEVYRLSTSIPEVEIRLKDFQNGYDDGYRDAQMVVGQVLKRRGFNVELVEGGEVEEIAQQEPVKELGWW